MLCIPAFFDEDEPAQTATDETVFYDGQVVNNGPAVTDATITIALPRQLRLASDVDTPVTRYQKWWPNDQKNDPVATPLTCTTSANGATVSCLTGPIAAGDNFLVDVALVGTSSAKAGTSASFKMSLAPVTSGLSFPSTSISGEIDFLGQAHLVVTLTPHSATITVGSSRTLIGTVRNDGPDPASNVLSVGIVAAGPLNGPDFPKLSKHFVITNSAPLPDPGGAAALVVRAATEPSPQFAFWPVGTIAPGKTASVKVAVKALSTGRATLGFAAFSDADDPPCDADDDSACQEEDDAALIAVATPATTPRTITAPRTTIPATATIAPTTTAPISSAATAAALPDTGFRPTPWLGSGAAAILFGAALILLGAPRRTRARHR